jgi:hypothetical protein
MINEIVTAYLRLRSVIDSELRESDTAISASDAMILYWVATYHTTVTYHEVTSVFGIGARYNLAKLEEAGLVSINTDGQDRRRRLVRITQRANEVIDTLHRIDKGGMP